MARRKVSFIETAIPPKRGVARHFENNENRAETIFATDGSVKEIHTPQDALRRVHEVMHARHTNCRDYAGRHPLVRNLIEDCRLHLNHWPWKGEATPSAIVDDVDLMFKLEAKRRIEAKKEFDRIDPFSDFAQILRENAVMVGMNGPNRMKDFGFVKPFTTHAQAQLANSLFLQIMSGQHNEAAYALEAVFFGEELKEEEERRRMEELTKIEDEIDRKRGKKVKEKGEKSRDPDASGHEEEEGDVAARTGSRYHGDGGLTPSKMDIIELPLVEDTHSVDRGFRMATSGSRIYRPALRRPVLPHRLFLKQAPIAPGGAILFDASGSMGVDSKMLLDCCRRTPAATVAFYCGIDGGNCGWLYVYAKDGRRASGDPALFPDHEGGNGCDGAALEWLMKQEGPRIMVTDKQFTCNDAHIHVAKLEVYEMLGEVTVYPRYTHFFKDHPPTELFGA